MNKKILVLLSVVIVAISLVSVCAADLSKENDFDGKFKMNVPDNSAFDEVVDGTGASALLSDKSWSDNQSILVCYYEDAMDNVLSKLKTNAGYMDDPQKDGNLVILEYSDYGEAGTESYAFHYFVGVSSPNNTTVFLGSNDLNSTKEYANTISFN